MSDGLAWFPWLMSTKTAYVNRISGEQVADLIVIIASHISRSSGPYEMVTAR